MINTWVRVRVRVRVRCQVRAKVRVSIPRAPCTPWRLEVYRGVWQPIKVRDRVKASRSIERIWQLNEDRDRVKESRSSERVGSI